MVILGAFFVMNLILGVLSGWVDACEDSYFKLMSPIPVHIKYFVFLCQSGKQACFVPYIMKRPSYIGFLKTTLININKCRSCTIITLQDGTVMMIHVNVIKVQKTDNPVFCLYKYFCCPAFSVDCDTTVMLKVENWLS
jgi:hypothetical protein